jgi:hypothetical protein
MDGCVAMFQNICMGWVDGVQAIEGAIKEEDRRRKVS